MDELKRDRHFEDSAKPIVSDRTRSRSRSRSRDRDRDRIRSNSRKQEEKDETIEVSDSSSVYTATSLSRSLARVEWQLIMRCCDLPSLLQLARVNRSTMNAASSDFAWSSLSPVILTNPIRPQLHDRVSRSLLRFVDIGFRWSPGRSRNYYNPLVIDAIIAEQYPRLRWLDASWLPPGVIGMMFAAASRPLRSLTALLVMSNLPNPLSMLLETCSSTLRTLRAEVFNAENLRILMQLPLLTDLSLVATLDAEGMQPLIDYKGRGERSRDESEKDSVDPGLHLSHCQLIRLSLEHLRSNAWSPVLTSSNMRGLRELTLKRADASFTSAVHWPSTSFTDALLIDWNACFLNLPELQRLTFIDCSKIETLLLALLTGPDVVPNLLSLHIHSFEMRPSNHSIEMRGGNAIPPATLISDLLRRRSDSFSMQLSVESEMMHATESKFMGHPHTEESASKEWNDAFQPFADLTEIFQQRLQLFFFTGPI